MPFARASSAAILQPLSSQRTAGPSRPHTASARSLRFKPREGPVPTCQHPPREQRQAAPYRSLGLPDPSRSLLADFSWRLPRHVESACSLHDLCATARHCSSPPRGVRRAATIAFVNVGHHPQHQPWPRPLWLSLRAAGILPATCGLSRQHSYGPSNGPDYRHLRLERAWNERKQQRRRRRRWRQRRWR